jgi:hypothetical protein
MSLVYYSYIYLSPLRGARSVNERRHLHLFTNLQMAKALFQTFVPALLALSGCVFDTALAAPSKLDVRQASWPYGPLVTSGQYIKNTKGENVVYAGANWPGAADVMIPEGLQYQSIKSIVSKLKSLGMNAIRLTYAIELVDQIYENGGKDVSIQTAFTSALGQAKGTAAFNKVVANNPSFNASTTRLQVYDAIAAECTAQQIYVHLDNHVSIKNKSYFQCFSNRVEMWRNTSHSWPFAWDREWLKASCAVVSGLE